MAIMWLIRTKNNAYYWAYHTSNLDNTLMKMPIEARGLQALGTDAAARF